MIMSLFSSWFHFRDWKWISKSLLEVPYENYSLFKNNWPTLPWQGLHFWELFIQKVEKFFSLMQHMLCQMFHLEDNHADENKLPYKWTFTELVGILVWPWDGLILPLSGSEYLNLFFKIVVIMSCARNCRPSAPSVVKNSESFRVKCL